MLAERALPEPDERIRSVAEPETGSIILSFARKILRMFEPGGMDDALPDGVSCSVPRLAFGLLIFVKGCQVAACPEVCWSTHD